MRRHGLKQTFLLGLTVLCSLLLLTCANPVGVRTSTNTSSASTSLTISFQSHARTLVASIASYTVTLTSVEGFTTPGPLSNPTSVTFTNIAAGHWDISVAAYNGTTIVGGGSLLNQLLTNGTPLTLTVPISYSNAPAGTGNFSLPFTYPDTLDIRYVEAQLYNSGNTPYGAMIPIVPVHGAGIYSATVAQSGIPGGGYRLKLSFYNGATNAASLAGVYSEAINLWNGVTSDQWIDSAGSQFSTRTFAVNDFNSTDSTLLDLTVTGGATTLGGFSSGTLVYNAVANTPVVFTPVQQLPGQSIQFSPDNGTSWSPLNSGASSAGVAAGNTVKIRVTATDKATQSLYTITVGGQVNMDWATISTPGNPAVGIGGPATVSYGAPSTFTGTYAGTAATWTWYVDNSTTPVLGPSTASSVAIVASPSNYPYGTHTLMAVVQDSTTLLSYSTSLSFSVIANVPATTGLVGEWMMAGSADDTSGNGNNGVIAGTATVANHLGVANRALSFGLNDSIVLSTPPLGGGLSTPTSYSISVWIRPTAPGAWYIQNIFSQLDGTSQDTNLAAMLDLTSHPVTYAYPPGGANQVTSLSAVPLSSWHHLVFTRSASDRKIYLDTNLVLEDTANPTTYSGTNPIVSAVIGGYYHWSGQQMWLSGSLDSLRIYNRELTTTEINALYHEGGY